MAQLGYTTSPTAGSDSWHNYWGSQMAVSGVAGDADTMYIWAFYSGSGFNVALGVYADDGADSPDGQALLSDSIVLSDTGLVNVSTLESGVLNWTGIAASTKYHMGFNGQHTGSGAFNMKYDVVSGSQLYYKARTYDGTVPDPAPSTLTDYGTANQFGLYVD